MMNFSPLNPLPFFAVTLGVTLMGTSEGTVIIDQIGTASAYDFNGAADSSPSQIFTDFPSFDSQVLEDFTVTSSDLTIAQVSVLFQAQGGFDSFQDVDGFTLNIYSDINLAGVSLVGDVANLLVLTGASASVSQIIDGGSGAEYGLVQLSVDITLPSEGIYWVGVSPRSALSGTGQFLIPFGGATGLTTPGNADARFANPSDGFGNGALSILNQDYAYSVTSVPEPGSASMWILGTTALWMRRRRSNDS